ncbi:MAG: hypothetical protein AAGC54_02880, partial [Cyanobacteria bacterium P01_F01_bin.4]
PGFWPPFVPERLQYDELISYYQKLFGPEQVLVISYEDFKKSNIDTLNKILEFVGVSEKNIILPQSSQAEINIGDRGLSLELKRRLNHVMPKVYFGGQKASLSHRISGKMVKAFNLLVPKSMNDAVDAQLYEEIDNFVGKFYDESNARLKALTGINIR